MSDASRKGSSKPPSFGTRGVSRDKAMRPLPGTVYAMPADPVAAAATRRKRTVGISLVLAGMGAFGLYAHERRQQCLEQNPQNPDACRSSSRSSTSSSSRWFGSSSSSSSSTRTSQSATTRGGFGSSAVGFHGGS